MPHVVIVEDDEFLSELLAKKLRDEGLEVEQAFNGEVGVQTILTQKPNVVLLDLLLPGLDGFGVLEKIRASSDEKVKGTTVLVVSNYGEEEMISRAQGLGITDYMVKANFSTSDILAKVKEQLEVQGVTVGGEAASPSGAAEQPGPAPAQQPVAPAPTEVPATPGNSAAPMPAVPATPQPVPVPSPAPQPAQPLQPEPAPAGPAPQVPPEPAPEELAQAPTPVPAPSGPPAPQPMNPPQPPAPPQAAPTSYRVNSYFGESEPEDEDGDILAGFF